MEHIGGILARNQQGHSPTSRQIEQTCTCGVQFMATVWIRPDGSEVTPYELCPECREKEFLEKERQEAEAGLKRAVELQAEKWPEIAQMPTAFTSKTFTNFDKKLQPKAYDATRNLHWKGQKDASGESLVLLSPGVYGVGKTHLVCALMNKIIKEEEKAILGRDLAIRFRQCPVFFTSENLLLRRLRNTFNRDKRNDFTEDYEQTEEDIYAELKRFPLLIIDDVGKVRPRDLNFLQGVYLNIIDQRYTDEQPLILTTNLNLNELEAHIGGACADRLREMAGKEGFIVMKGQSYRRST